jgi:hypothetical protein
VGTSFLFFAQPLDGDAVAAMRGNIVTISAKVRSGANWSSSSFIFQLLSGTAVAGPAKRGFSGGYTGETTVAQTIVNLSTSSPVTTMTATSAAVFPTNATQAELDFDWAPTGSAGAADYIEVDEVQITITPVATAFERRRFDEELAVCRRFYQKAFPYAVAPAQGLVTSYTRWRADIAGAVGGFFERAYGTPMRALPSVTYYNPLAANAQVRDLSAGADCSGTVAAGTSSEQALHISYVGNGATTVGNMMGVNWTAEAEI